VTEDHDLVMLNHCMVRYKKLWQCQIRSSASTERNVSNIRVMASQK